MERQQLGTEHDIVQRTAVGAPVRQDFERADTRWSRASSLRDWIILLILIVTLVALYVRRAGTEELV
jgi:hypothetical protein